MGNPQLQARMQSLRNDPEFADFFKDIASGGIQASRASAAQRAQHIMAFGA